MAQYNLNKLSDFSIADIVYCDTEEYQKINNIKEKFNVMPGEKAKKKMDGWRSQLEPIIPGSEKIDNASETITRFFETISWGIQACLAINYIDQLLDYYERKK